MSSENSWAFGQILPIMLLVIPIISFAEGFTTQRAEEAFRRDNQYADDEFAIAHTDPQAAVDTVSLHGRSRNKSKPEPKENKEINQNQGNIPPWHCDETIYDSHFVIFSFWGSQAGILALITLLFIIFYFGLFLPWWAPGKSQHESTLQTDFGIWFIVGITLLGWVVVGVTLRTGGAMFSSLFSVDKGLATDDGQASLNTENVCNNYCYIIKDERMILRSQMDHSNSWNTSGKNTFEVS